MNRSLNQWSEADQTDLALWLKLKEQSLVQGEMLSSNLNETPWYIRAMQGFAGWIAAFFLLGFFGTTLGWMFDRESAVVLLSIGLIGNAIAYTIFRFDHNNHFVEQLGIVVNLCGQLMVAWGIYETLRSLGADFFLTLFFYQIILVVALSNFTSRLLTMFFAMIALFACFEHVGIFHISATIANLMFVLVWVNDIKWKSHKSLWEPIGYGLAFSLLLLNSESLMGDGSRWIFDNNIGWFNEYSYWISKAFIVSIFVGLLIKLTKHHKIKMESKAGRLIIASSIILVAVSYFVIGASAAILLVLIGFMCQRPVLIATGIVAFLGFISWYYYHLEVTLLTKSIILIGFGICFLAGFYVLSQYGNKKAILLNNLKDKYQMNRRKWITVSSMILVLLLVNANIYKKETILDSGEIVLLELAPVDPRSLMQGDYMRLRFAIERDLTKIISDKSISKSNSISYFVVNRDENNVGKLSHLDKNNELDNNQVKMQFRMKHNRIKLATNDFFFQEGTASEYSEARYGEFRVAEDGELLLNNLRDKSFNILGFNRPSN